MPTCRFLDTNCCLNIFLFGRYQYCTAISHIKITLNRGRCSMWRHRVVWYVGSVVLSHSTEPNPHDASRMFRDASTSCTRTAGVTTNRQNGIDTFCLSYCNCPLCAAKQQRTSELQLPFVCRQTAAHIRTATALCVPPSSSAHHKTYRSLLLPEFFADILGSLQKPVE